jgi:predicted RNase H-like HicB family nuclease
MKVQLQVNVKFDVVIHRDESITDYELWVSHCPLLDIYSQGESFQQAQEAIIDAIELYLKCVEKPMLPKFGPDMMDYRGLISKDPVAQWMKDHQEEVLKYAGQRVAIHPVKGIISHGDDINTVWKEVMEMGLLDEVVFDYIQSF